MMAVNLSKTPFLCGLAKRSVTQCAPKPQCSSDPKVVLLPNKLFVANADANVPLAKVSIAIRAGSRYEVPDNLGVTHMLRIVAGLGTSHSSAFAITRNIQQLGGNLSITGDRENITYTIETTLDKFEAGLPFLTDVVTRQVFKPWEVNDNLFRVKYELGALSKQVKVLDLLHTAAYRTGLGNSLFLRKYLLGKISPETLQHYVCTYFRPSRTAVVGIGVDQPTLVDFAGCLALGGDDDLPVDCPARYHGGEIRKDKEGSMAYIAIAAEAVGLNVKDVMSYAVLRYALGAGPSVKWCSGTEPLNMATSSLPQPASANAFLAAYSDSGLFGLLIAASADTAGQAVDSAMKVLADGPSDADISRGLAQLKADLLYSVESSEGLSQDIVSQLLTFGCYSTPQQFITSLESVKPDQVKAAAAKIAKGRKSMAAIGDLRNVPFLDHLK